MTDAIGYFAGLLAMLSFMPQIVKTFRTKRADDLSMSMLFLTLATNITYFVYGYLQRLYPIVVMIGIMTGIVLLQILLTAKYRIGRSGTPGTGV
jgi:MtN3 and saliva related transmembrane protein